MNLFRGSHALLILSFLLVHAIPAQAEYLNHIEVVQSETSNDFVIHFDQNILFEKNSPLNEAKVLFIRLRIQDTRAITEERTFVEETLRVKSKDGLPGISVSYANNNNQLIVTFSRSTKYTVRPGVDSRSIVISLAPTLKKEPVLVKERPAPVEIAPPPVTAKAAPPTVVEAPIVAPTPPPTTQAPAGAPVAPVAAPTRSPEEIERIAKALLEEAQHALAQKDAATAINRLNRILGFPGNAQTQAAQALIGEAREQNGEITKARAEYETYLKLYPNGLEAARIREHLAALPKSQIRARRALPKEAGPAQWTFFGYASANYYGGSSLIDTTTIQGTNVVNQSRLAIVDQKSLITSINLNARRRDAFSDTRIVVRETNNNDALDSSRNYNRLYAAYVDHNDKNIGYYVRFGRQNPNGLGVFERFDGAQAGYNLNSEWRINGVYGEAVEFNSPFKRIFYGASVDFLPQQSGVPGVSLYALNQTLDGFENRRALGTEVRYFDGHINAYGTLDYDILYKGLNIALVQGNYLTDGGTNYFAVYDRRRAPSLGLTNALLAAPGVSLQQLIASQGLEVTRQQAKDLSAISSSLSFGFTHPLTPDWQVGADYRLSEISSTQPITVTIPISVIGTCVGTIDPNNVQNCIFDTASQQASGLNHALSFQLTGNNLFFTNAVGVSSASFVKAPSFNGQSYSIGYVLPIAQQWRIDTSLRYYTQKDNVGTSISRLSPNLRLSYQWQDSLFLEGEIGRETSKTNSTTQNDQTTRNYFSAGVRWEFR